MCGIFGAVSLDGVLSPDQRKFIHTSTHVGQVRGEDGTGWILYNKNDGTNIYKRAVCGADFLGTHQGQLAESSLRRASIAIGHNRKTTSGNNRDIDCHPYQYDNVVGVHNGGIPSVVLNRLEFKNPVADVDSAKLYAALNAVENPVDVLSKIHTGAYALVWLDNRKDVMHIARNGDRPMWAASGDKGLYFASEPGMLFWLMSRYGLQAKDSKLFELDPLHLYTIPFDKPSKVGRDEYKIDMPTYNHGPQGGTAAASQPGNDARGWFTNRGGAGDHMEYKFIHTVGGMSHQYPVLKYAQGILESNIDAINRQIDEDSKKKGTHDPLRRNRVLHLDVVVTGVVQRSGNPKYPDIVGYVSDVTNSDLTIPVQLLAVKDNGEDFLKRYKDALKNDELFMLRGVVRNIRVHASGTIVLAMGLVTVWEGWTEEIDDEVQLRSLEVDEATAETAAAFTAVQLKEMWAELRKPVTLPTKFSDAVKEV